MRLNDKILIIDDSVTSQNILEKVLGTCGYHNIIKASSAWEGIDSLHQAFDSEGTLPDLILMDVIMPEINGIDATKRIKSHSVFSGIPIIIISMKDDAETLSQAFKAGASDYILKPVSIPVLKARVDAILKLKRETDKRRQQEEELIKLNKKLEHTNEVKNRFLGTAAHDLRSPLASIRGFAEMLIDELENELNEEQIEMLKMIQETSHGMLSLVNDLLDYAVIESGKLALIKQDFNLMKVLDRRITLNEPNSKKKNIALIKDLGDIGLISIDKNRIDQVIDNLISNAIKFSPQNTEVTVKLYKDGKYACFSVDDQGVGISESDMPKLFGEFCTLDSKPTEGEKSTGLGLSIVKSIVFAHNGKLDVNSEKNKGTSIIVKLPMETNK